MHTKMPKKKVKLELICSFSILNSKLAFKIYFLRLSKVVEKIKLHIILKFQKYTANN